MTPTSLSTWLCETSMRDALLGAWRSAETDAISSYEATALAIAGLGIKAGRHVAVGQPGGRSRLPLLAGVHAATLQLPSYPSPFAPARRGPVVFATRQVIRRDELMTIDAAGVPVSLALHPVRLRRDGLCVPLHGGRPLQQELSHRLVLVRDFFVSPRLPPVAVVIDAAAEDDSYVVAAMAWAREIGATAVLFDDSARRRWPEGALVYCGGWAAINADSADNGDAVAQLAPTRGHAAVVDAGPQRDLDQSRVLLNDARRRRRGPVPAQLVEAATLWRRLDELVVPLQDYDAACPRWHTLSLRGRLDDLADVRASEFPDGWRTWAEMCWAGIKEGIAAARDALSDRNTKASLLIELVDAELRAGRDVDLALPSRTARDATLRFLAAAGVVIPVDGRLRIRSLGDPDTWGPPRLTLLAAPPVKRLQHRLTAADVGPLNVLCYAHETASLRAALIGNLDEPLAPIGPIDELLPSALDVRIDLPILVPEIALTSLAATATTPGGRRVVRLVDLASAADAAGLAALNTPAQELPDDGTGSDIIDGWLGSARAESSRAVIPLTVTPLGAEAAPRVVNIPVQRRVLRIFAGKALRIPVLDVAPTMLVADIEGPTAFERLRSLLVEARGPVIRMLLAAWDQALEMALYKCGSVAELTRRLSCEGSTIGPDAVSSWTDSDRIGPREVADIARIGRIAAHPVAELNSTAIAGAMSQLRQLHQEVGRAVVGAVTGDADTSAQLDALLGADAVSVVNETVVYRVVTVGPATITKTDIPRATRSDYASWSSEEWE